MKFDVLFLKLPPRYTSSSGSLCEATGISSLLKVPQYKRSCIWLLQHTEKTGVNTCRYLEVFTFVSCKRPNVSMVGNFFSASPSYSKWRGLKGRSGS